MLYLLITIWIWILRRTSMHSGGWCRITHSSLCWSRSMLDILLLELRLDYLKQMLCGWWMSLCGLSIWTKEPALAQIGEWLFFLCYLLSWIAMKMSVARIVSIVIHRWLCIVWKSAFTLNGGTVLLSQSHLTFLCLTIAGRFWQTNDWLRLSGIFNRFNLLGF